MSRLVALALFLCFALAAPAIPAQSTDYEADFSAYGQSLQLLLKTINGAQKSIRVAAYSFISAPIAEALKEAHRRGVDVKVVADRDGNAGRQTTVTFLANQGVPVRLNGQFAMHHKFMVIDSMRLQTDSISCQASIVNNNAENVLVLHDAPVMVEQYELEWEKLWNEGVDLVPNY